MAGGKTSGWVSAVVAPVTTLVTAACGWFAVWSAPVNGDEGYLVVSLREWFVRGGLDGRLYSQCGPFYCSHFELPSRAPDEQRVVIVSDGEQLADIAVLGDSGRARAVLSINGETLHQDRIAPSRFVARRQLVRYLEQRWKSVGTVGGMQILLARQTP